MKIKNIFKFVKKTSATSHYKNLKPVFAPTFEKKAVQESNTHWLAIKRNQDFINDCMRKNPLPY